MAAQLLSIVEHIWQIMLASSGWILLGLLLAGLMEEVIPKNLIQRHLAGERPAAILKAALIGAPMPLCSCSVLPTAASLRRFGAGRGPTAAFLVSTPETGVDSISTTWALLDPVTTIVRPIAAIVSAIWTGLMVSLAGGPAPPASAELGKGKCSGEGVSSPAPSQKTSGESLLMRSLRRALGPLSRDLAFWLSIGLLLAGVAGAFLPDDLLGSGTSRLTQYSLALLAGVPVYVCATASTPLAAALVAKGMDPGAALVFLLAGPATNLATVTVVRGLLGMRATLYYLFSISSGAVLGGLVLTWIQHLFEISPRETIKAHLHGEAGPFDTVFAVALLLLLTIHLIPKRTSSDHAR